jgi:hypothetical protein
VAEVRGQLCNPGVHIDPQAMGIDEAVDGKGMPEVMFVPKSAQS